jgi:hypothetical protein
MDMSLVGSRLPPSTIQCWFASFPMHYQWMREVAGSTPGLDFSINGHVFVPNWPLPQPVLVCLVSPAVSMDMSLCWFQIGHLPLPVLVWLVSCGITISGHVLVPDFSIALVSMDMSLVGSRLPPSTIECWFALFPLQYQWTCLCSKFAPSTTSVGLPSLQYQWTCLLLVPDWPLATSSAGLTCFLQYHYQWTWLGSRLFHCTIQCWFALFPLQYQSCQFQIFPFHYAVLVCCINRHVSCTCAINPNYVIL